MLDQVAQLNPEDAADFTAPEVEVSLSHSGHYPMPVFTLPEPIAYSECTLLARSSKRQ